jgi:hypothetical protein
MEHILCERAARKGKVSLDTGLYEPEGAQGPAKEYVPPTKLCGRISNLKVTRASANFFFTESDQAGMGMLAVGAGPVGVSGQAIGMAIYSTDLEEEADYLEFDIDGQPVKGWVWRNPFKDGDEVEVASEWNGQFYESFGITRPKDKIIALYPHCSRGRNSHRRNGWKWWFTGTTAMIILVAVFFFIAGLFKAESLSENIELLKFGMGVVISTFYPIAAIMTYSLLNKWIDFVYAAEKVFLVLGWDNIRDVDLPKRSQETKTGNEEYGYGTFFFRY